MDNEAHTPEVIAAELLTVGATGCRLKARVGEKQRERTIPLDAASIRAVSDELLSAGADRVSVYGTSAGKYIKGSVRHVVRISDCEEEVMSTIEKRTRQVIAEEHSAVRTSTDGMAQQTLQVLIPNIINGAGTTSEALASMSREFAKMSGEALKQSYRVVEAVGLANAQRAHDDGVALGRALAASEALGEELKLSLQEVIELRAERDKLEQEAAKLRERAGWVPILGTLAMSFKSGAAAGAGGDGHEPEDPDFAKFKAYLDAAPDEAIVNLLSVVKLVRPEAWKKAQG